jgi:hypothetical protein
MTEMVTVPGVGPVKKPMLIGVVAVGAGVVGYAWWQQRGRGSAAADVAPNPDLIPETDRTPVVGDSTGSWDTTTGNTTIDTNSEWTQAATEYLINLGYEAGAVSGALGKFMAHQPLTEPEVQVVLAAKAAFGDPPVGGPWPVTAAPAAAVPTAPKNFRVTGTRILVSGPDYARVDLDWEPVAGAIGYQLTAYDVTGNAAAGNQDSADTTHIYQPLWRGHEYRFTVAAVTGSGTGPTSTVSATTPRT